MRQLTGMDDPLARCPGTLHHSHHSRPVNGSEKMWAMIRLEVHPTLTPAAPSAPSKWEGLVIRSGWRVAVYPRPNTYLSATPATAADPSAAPPLKVAKLHAGATD